mgnify:CR=1 FL=1
MAEVTRSPEMYLGKRRSSNDNSTEIEIDNPNQYIKRHRVTCRNGLDGLRHGDENTLHAFKRNKSGSIGGQQETTESVTHFRPTDQLEQYHQSVIASLKMEHQMALSRKDQEIQHIQQQNAQLNMRCQAMTNEHNAVLEENRVLKRAVAIQESRHRELSANHDQLQHVMGLAAEHVAKLEQANRDLTALVESSYQYGGGGSSGGFPRGPPDVY